MKVGEATRWKPGQSPNPGGISTYERELRVAVRNQETPARVCEVVDALRADALAGTKTSPSSAKVYLDAVGLPKPPPEFQIDLTNAPPEVIKWLTPLLLGGK